MTFDTRGVGESGGRISWTMCPESEDYQVRFGTYRGGCRCGAYRDWAAQRRCGTLLMRMYKQLTQRDTVLAHCSTWLANLQGIDRARAAHGSMERGALTLCSSLIPPRCPVGPDVFSWQLFPASIGTDGAKVCRRQYTRLAGHDDSRPIYVCIGGLPMC